LANPDSKPEQAEFNKRRGVVTHNLASQVFYDDEKIYNLATGLTIHAEPYTDSVDLGSADESKAAKSLSKQAKAIRKSLPATIGDL
jgi:hypothetical protein